MYVGFFFFFFFFLRKRKEEEEGGGGGGGYLVSWYLNGWTYLIQVSHSVK